MQRQQLKRQNILEFAISMGILVLIAILSAYLFARIDLTSDKRYTLSKHTKQMMRDLNDIVFFKVYLEGDLPAGFKRLQNSTREMLDELRAYGGDNIQYEFIDPSENPNQKAREDVYRQLYQKGLDPTNLQIKEKDGGTSQKIIFPGIIVSYHGKEIPVNILKNHVSTSTEGNILNSLQSLEYDLTFAINQLTIDHVPTIGFTEGHGELDQLKVEDFAYALSQFYTLKRVKTDEFLYSLRDTLGRLRYNLLIIAKPDSAFSEKDKFIIDQYIMAGGRVLWLIDNVMVNMDSLAYSRSTMGLQASLNLDDMLFNYGVRINLNLIQDMQCAMIPVNTALVGQQPKFAPANWIYFPLVTPEPKVAITKNLDMVRVEFASSMDTVGLDPKVKKTFLLRSSKYSRWVNAPARVDLSIIGDKIDPQRFNRPQLPIAVLLEGSFRSVYTNRITPQIAGSKEIGFKSQSEPTRMIVISDGDIIRNQLKMNGNKPEALPLGYDRVTKETFGNKEFLMNCVNYLCGFEGLMESRSKDFKLRLLDQPRIMKERLTWQIINVGIPVILVILSGLLFNYLRRKKYQK
jgi:ABC-2 type transport system permease protein